MLILINGKCFIFSNLFVGGGSVLGVQVDVNNIFVLLIDCVEVMKVGGVFVYGVDVVVGVVNYILKCDYEGFEIFYDYIYQDGILSDQFVCILLGGNFDGGCGNVMVVFEYNE